MRGREARASRQIHDLEVASSKGVEASITPENPAPATKTPSLENLPRSLTLKDVNPSQLHRNSDCYLELGEGSVKMRLDKIARKTRLRALSTEQDICCLLFEHEKARRACRVFLNWLKNNGGEATRHEVSTFGYDLQAGKIIDGFTYRRENFYRIVLRRLVNLGFIGLQNRFEKGRVIRKYAPIYQPIPKRTPGGRNFYNISWQLCKKWNQEWVKT